MRRVGLRQRAGADTLGRAVSAADDAANDRPDTSARADLCGVLAFRSRVAVVLAVFFKLIVFE